MRRERALKAVLVVVGLLFIAGIVPLTMFFSREPVVPMIMSTYVTLGIFLLLAVRNPAANRSLIAFAGWANLPQVTIGESEIEVRFQKRAHNPLLMAAGLDKEHPSIPWLGNKRLQLTFG